jgi:acetyl-CoA synthetase
MNGKWIWEPTAEFRDKTNISRFMRRLGFNDRESFLSFSRENSELFWAAMVQEAGIDWFRPYEKVLDLSRGVEWSRWFVNGKLNIAHNCLDRHAKGPNAGEIACL